jgi:ribonuclease BN (tRNA processing enzyme)
MKRKKYPRVTVIGSGVALPSLRRRSPGLLVETAEEKILFDCGPDILRGLLRAGIDYREIDRILVTHFHPDHTLGLPHLLFATRYALRPREKDLWIAGPPGLAELLEKFRGIYPAWLEEKGYRLREHIIRGGRWSGADWKLQAAPVDHNPESIAYRLEAGGRSVVFSGDTGSCDSLVELSRGADLLVCEASFPEKMALPKHLTPARAGEVARRAGVKKLLLTHMYPPCDRIDAVAAARREFNGPVLRAEDGMTIWGRT